MDAARHYDELQQRAASYGEHLDGLVTSAARFTLAALGSGAALLASGVIEDVYLPFVLAAATLLLVSLSLICVLYLGHPKVVPSRVELDLEVHKYCADNSALWNKLRVSALGSFWVAIVIAAALVFLSLTIDHDEPLIAFDTVVIIGQVLALGAVLLVLYDFGRVSRYIFGRYPTDQRKRLRAGQIWDLGGYKPGEEVRCRLARKWGKLLQSPRPQAVSTVAATSVQPDSTQMPHRGLPSVSGHVSKSVMPLRPTELDVRENDPFADDALNRQAQIEALGYRLVKEEQAAIISINGGFGTGKSTFLKMLAEHLRSQDVDVQEFNAWQQSHTEDPLVDLVSALAQGTDSTSGLLQLAREYGLRIVKGAMTTAVRLAFSGIIDPKDFAGVDVESPVGYFSAWAHAECKTAEFKKELEEVVQKGSGKLVVVVDELDRCRPGYALDLLSVVRYLFDAPGVVTVLGVNRRELEYRVQKVLGDACDADEYLRRFVDLPINLSAPTVGELTTFANSIINDTALRTHSQSEIFEESLAYLIAESHLSLRDAQQMARLNATVASPSGRQDTEWQIAALAMLMLRRIDRDFYVEFLAGKRDGIDAVKKLRETLPGMWQQDPEFGVAIYYLEVSLLHMLLPASGPTVKMKGFVGRFVKAKLGDEATAKAIRADWKHKLRSTGPYSGGASGYNGLCPASDIAKQIEGDL
ncbi:KAP family P-loop NTPase fold protein [Candidatus Poriferisodalis sp.]|uniref:KAP family P-loop NTPase fold protein n=1 Tax=Candidatus Poriferisodalis sp. TaxID=3101277 RepID=UPI003B02C044